MPDEVMSARDALAKAFSEAPEVEAVAEAPADEPPAVEAETPPAEGRERDEFGRFRAKDAEPEADAAPAVVAEVAAPVVEAPVATPADDAILGQLNDPLARKAWASVDPVVKAEVGRRIEQLQDGIEKYRAEIEPIRRFADMAKAGGTTLDAALANYTNIEQMLARNPVEGVDLILRNMGSDVRSFAAHVLGQPAPEPNAQVDQLRQQLHAATQELVGYRSERERTLTTQVADFATANPRFNELSEDIAWLLKTGGARDLASAYRKAEFMNPIPAPAARTGPAERPEPRKQPVSVRGAPSSGSNPVRATEVMSAREAIQRAMAATR